MPRSSVYSIRTKRDFLDRMLSIDFSGDLRTLAPDVHLTRIRANAVQVYFPTSGEKYVLTVSRPREAAAPAPTRARVGSKPSAPARMEAEDVEAEGEDVQAGPPAGTKKRPPAPNKGSRGNNVPASTAGRARSPARATH